eukprot:COSAG02_NODE_1520_length_12166_cov_8.338195_2_plen_104_part_00
MWGGGPAFGQRLADRQGVRHRGENRVSSHTSLHTNLPISVRKCARGTRTGSRQRGLSGVEDLTSYPEMYCQPRGILIRFILRYSTGTQIQLYTHKSIREPVTL